MMSFNAPKPTASGLLCRAWLAIAALLVSATSAWAQPLSGVVNIPGDYGSLNAAIGALNTNGVAVGGGGVVLNVLEDQIIPVGGYEILSNASGSENDPVVIRGNAHTVTANPGLASNSLTDALFKIIGADWVTIEDFVMRENPVNTNTSSAPNPNGNNMTEWGVAVLYASTTDGAQHVTIRNNTISLNRTYQNTFGIYSNSTHAPGTPATGASPTAATGSNTGLVIQGNTISNVNNGIVVVGPTAAVAHNEELTIGGTLPGQGNTLTNYGTTGTFSSYVNVSGSVNGILVRNTRNYTIANNSVTSSSGGVTAGTMRAIYVNAYSNAPTGTLTQRITGNTIALLSGGTSTTVQGIMVESSTGTSTSSLVIDGNNFTQMAYSAGTGSGAFTLISNAMAALNTSISNNTFSGLTCNTTGSLTFITASYPIPANGSQTVSNNSIVGGFNKTGAGGTVTLFTNAGTSPATATFTGIGNNFSGITVTGATTIDGFRNTDGGSPAKTVTGNTFSNWTGGTNAITALTVSFSGSADVSNNTVGPITAAASITGITSASGTQTFTNNTVRGLVSTSTSGTVIGISVTGGATQQLLRNKVFDLETASTSTTTGALSGILVSSGTTVTVANNIVGDLRAPAGNSTDVIRGISMTGGTTVNVAYNTVRLDAALSSGTNFGSSAIYSIGGSTPNLTLRNNIAVNLSVPKGTGRTVAYRRSSTTIGGYNSTSNNNLFYAGIPGANNLIYTDGTNLDQTLAAFKARVSPRDALSVTENPIFASTTSGSADFLRFAPATSTQAESGGAVTAGLDDDVDGDVRQGSAGYAGTGSAPDIGADEFEGQPIDLVPPAVSFTPLSATCTGDARTLEATITDASGVPTSGSGLPVLYWRIGTGTWQAATGTHTGGDTYSFTFGAGTPNGTQVQYYIVAQDGAASPNVGSFPIAGAADLTADPPAAGTPPTTPVSYAVEMLLVNSFTVGTGGDFATLTAAAAAYNTTQCMTGPVEFVLTNSTYNTASGETFPIVFNATSQASATNTLTIRPQTTATITGSVSSGGIIRLNGADWITIDGSNSGGADRSLTITNTNTSSPVGIWISSLGNGTGATNNTVKNTVINTLSGSVTYGMAISGSSVTAQGGDNDAITIVNNAINSNNIGIYVNGNATTSAGAVDGLTLSDNVIVTNGGVSPGIGIQLLRAIGATISGSTIDVQNSAGTRPIGISVETGVSNTSVIGNRIERVLASSSSGWGARGICIGTGSATSNIVVANNFVAGVNGSNWTGFGDSSAGIMIGSIGNSSTLTTTTGGVALYHNTVNMTGEYVTSTTVNKLTAALYVGSAASGLDIRNNIFVNTLNYTLAAKNYAIYSAAANTAYTTIDHNNYSASGEQGVLGYLGGDHTTLAELTTAFGGNAGSTDITPVFVSATDLHLPPAGNIALDGLGTELAAVTTDIDGDPRDASTPDMGADEFEVSGCLEPAGLTVSNITANSADVQWTTGPGVTDHEWEVRFTGAPGSGGAAALGNTAGTTAAPNGLDDGTSYFVYVRSVCGVQTSAWSAGVPFTTLPLPVATYPYTQDFGTTLPVAHKFTLVNGAQVNQWVVGSAVGAPANSLYVSNDAGANNAYTIATAATVHAWRDFDLSATGEYTLTFDWRSMGETSANDYVRVWITPTTYTPAAGTQTTTGNSSGLQLGGDLYNSASFQQAMRTIPASFVGTTARLVFEWRNNAGTGTQPPAAIDNVVMVYSSCISPTAAIISNVTATAATLNWTNSSATAYDYEVRTSGAAGSGATGLHSEGTVVGGPVILTLDPQTTYTVYLRSNCDPAFSPWAAVGSITTPKLPVSVFPWFEPFTANDGNFDFVNGSQINKWVWSSDAGNPANSLYISNNTTGTPPPNNYTTNSSTVTQVYRDLDLSVPGEYALAFDWRAQGEVSSGTNYDYLRVWMAPTTFVPTAGTQTTTGSGRTQLMAPDNGGNFMLSSVFRRDSLPIPASYVGGTARLIFEWRNDGTGGTQPPASIDNIRVSLNPCTAPTAASIGSVTATSAQLSFTASNAPAYDYEVRTSGAAGSGATGLVLSGTGASPIALSPLTPQTTYTVYVRGNCSPDLSSWVDAGTFTTTQQPATVPWYEPFTTGNGNFAFVNGSQTNQWVWNSGAGNPANSLYITNNTAGTPPPNQYSLSPSSVSHVYRDVDLTANGDYALAFDWRAMGEVSSGTNYDYIRVWLAPTTYVPTAGTQTSSGSGRTQLMAPDNGGNFMLSSVYRRDSLLIPNSFVGNVARVVFEWRNDGTGGTQPPASIDNIRLTKLPCVYPTAVAVNDMTVNSAELEWTNSDATLYDYEVRTSGAAGSGPVGLVLSGSAAAAPVTLEDLVPGTSFTVYVRANCAPNFSSWQQATFSTPCPPAFNVPWSDDFNAVTPPAIPSCWTVVDVNGPPTGSSGKWYSANTSGTNHRMTYSWHSTLPGDDWLISPPLSLEGGTSYTLTYTYWAGSTSWTEAMDVFLGTSPTVGGMTQLIVDHGTFNFTTPTTVDHAIVPPTTGTYYIGWHAKSLANRLSINLDNVSVVITPVCPTLTAATTEAVDCVGNDFQITLDVTDMGTADSLVVTSTIYGDAGAPQLWTVNGTGNTVIGPFPRTALVSLSVQGDGPDCLLPLGRHFSTCPIEVDCESPTPLVLHHCYEENDERTFTFRSNTPGRTLDLTFADGAIDENDAINLHDGGPGSSIYFTSSGSSLSLLGTLSSLGEEMTVSITTTSGNSCAEGSPGLGAGWTLNLRCSGCIEPFVQDVIPEVDCIAGTFTLPVEFYYFGYNYTLEQEALSAGIRYVVNGNEAAADTVVADMLEFVYHLGPFPLGSTVAITLLHEEGAACNGTVPTISVPWFPTCNNDLVCDALGVPVNANYTCTQTVPGNMTSATLTAGVPGTTTCTGTIAKDRWYRFTATQPTQRVQLSGTTTGLSHAVFSGSCDGTLTQVGSCITTTGQNNLSNLVVGDTYYIRVSTTTAGNTSAFNVCVSEPPVLDMRAMSLVTPAVPPVCYGPAETVTVRIRNNALHTPIDFSVNPVVITTTVTGTVNATLTTTLNSGVLAASSEMDVPMDQTLDMSAGGTYTFAATTVIAGDQVPGNNGFTGTGRTVTATVPMANVAVNFTGFTGANLTTVFPNWREATGATLPTGTTSGWTSSSTAQQTQLGSGVSARINFTSSLTRNEWLVGPRFTPQVGSLLRYRIAITESGSGAVDGGGGMQAAGAVNDRVVVRISTDCGASFTNVSTHNAATTAGVSNSLVQRTIDLSPYAGQEVIVAYWANATSASPHPSYDFHIDDIMIETVEVCSGAPVAGSISTTATLPLCAPGSATLTLSGHSTEAGEVISWWRSNAGAGGPYIVVPGAVTPGLPVTGLTDDAWFKARVTCAGDESFSETAPFHVEVNPTPVATASNNGPVCAGTEVQLTGGSDLPGATYAWNGPGAWTSAGQNPVRTVELAQAGNYTLTVTLDGCPSIPVSTTVAVTESPTINAVTATPNPVCVGADAQLLVVMPAAGAYCPVTFPSGVEAISRVQFADIDNQSDCTPVTSGGPLEDFTDIVGHVTAGNTYPITLTGNTNGAFTTHFRVFFDFDQDGIFEAEFNAGSITNTVCAVNATTDITIPASAANGNTRMRVVKRFSTVPDACNSSGYGQAEDYTINVSGGVAGYTYSWSPSTFLTDPTIADPVAENVTASQNYTVTVTGGNGCARSAQLALVAGEPLNVEVSPEEPAICIGQSVALTTTVTGGGTPYEYLWTPGDFDTANNTVAPTTTTNYNVRVTDACGTVVNVPVTVVVNQLPDVMIEPATDLICGEGSVDLEAVGAVEYTWSPTTGLDTTTGANVSAGPSATTTYTVSGTDANGCVNTAQATVTVAPGVGELSLVPNEASVCVDGNTSLVATPETGYALDAASGNISVAIPDGSLSGASSQLVLTGGPGTITAGTQVSVTLNISHTWANDLDIYLVGPSGCGTLELSTDNGGDGDNYTNVVLTTPSAFPSVAGAALGVSGSWSPEGTVTTPPALNSGVGSGIYALPSTPLVGCPVNGTWTLHVFDDAAIISGTVTNWSLSLNAGPPPNYYTHVITGPGIVGPVVAGGPGNNVGTASVDLTGLPPGDYTYTVVSTTTAGCSDSTTAVITVGAPLEVAVVATESEVCAGEATILNAVVDGGGEPYTYLWSPGGATTASIEVEPGTTTLYSVMVMDDCGGSGSADATITVHPLPSVAIVSSPPDASICDGAGSVSMTASGATSYTWSPATGLSATTGATVNATPASPTTYTVTGTDANGCQNTATRTVNVGDTPAVTAGASTMTTCAGGTVDLTASLPTSLTILSADFNGGAPAGWLTVNNSTGGTPGNAAWTIRTSPYSTWSSTLNSGDGDFYLTNGDAQGSSSTTSTELHTPVFSLVGYTSATLSFRHYYRDNNDAADNAYVEVSANGGSWAPVQTYETTQGAPGTFAAVSISLNDHIGNGNVRVRFRYVGTWDYGWAIDQVQVIGVPEEAVFSWTSVPAYFTSGVQNPTGVVVSSVPTTFTVTATSSAGCAGQASVTIGLDNTDTDGDGVVDCIDSCPTVPGQNGDFCDVDPGPEVVPGQLVGCTCQPASCTNDMLFETMMSGDGELPTWSVFEVATNTLVVSGGGDFATGNGFFSDAFCLPDGDFYIVVDNVPTDATYRVFGAVAPFPRVIDNTAPVQGTHQVELTPTSGGPVQLPMSEDRVLQLSCDKYWWKTGDYLVANENPAVAALWSNGNAAQQANTGYDFWFYDPNGTYSYVRQRRHNQADGYGNVGSARTCHMRVNSSLHGWATADHIPNGLPLNVRVRAVVNGTPGPWGPACRFVRDEALAACPPTTLWRTPVDDPKYSCDGATRKWTTHTNQRIFAHPVSGATQYRFRFMNANEGYDLTRTNTTYYLNMGWNASAGAPLVAGNTYQVTVQAFKGGSLGPNGDGWCAVGDPCTLMICGPQGQGCSGGMIGGGQNSALEDDAVQRPVLGLWPNPNRGDLLNLNITGLSMETGTLTMDILDLSGKRVGSHTIPVQDGSVTTVLTLNGDLAGGMYMIQILAGDQVFTERLVIQP